MKEKHIVKSREMHSQSMIEKIPMISCIYERDRGQFV